MCNCVDSIYKILYSWIVMINGDMTIRTMYECSCCKEHHVE